jgi:hypothetical protein
LIGVNWADVVSIGPGGATRWIDTSGVNRRFAAMMLAIAARAAFFTWVASSQCCRNKKSHGLFPSSAILEYSGGRRPLNKGSA